MMSRLQGFDASHGEHFLWIFQSFGNQAAGRLEFAHEIPPDGGAPPPLPPAPARGGTGYFLGGPAGTPEAAAAGPPNGAGCCCCCPLGLEEGTPGSNKPLATKCRLALLVGHAVPLLLERVANCWEHVERCRALL